MSVLWHMIVMSQLFTSLFIFNKKDDGRQTRQFISEQEDQLASFWFTLE
jgi:hypothetical protein